MTTCPNAKDVDKKYRSLQIHFYAAKTLYFLNIRYRCVQKGQMQKNRGQAISPCDFDQIRPTPIVKTRRVA